MPQLPPVAAAAFVFILLATIVITTAVVQVRARRRRLLLAAMVRDSAPIPRPTVSTVPAAPTVEAPVEETLLPLRGQDYGQAEREGRFDSYDDRTATREGAPGRPGRRLAAQVAYATSLAAPPLAATSMAETIAAEATAEAPADAPAIEMPAEVVRPAPTVEISPSTVAEPPAAAPLAPSELPALPGTHAGLESVTFDLDLRRDDGRPVLMAVPEPSAVVGAPMLAEPVVIESADVEPQKAEPLLLARVGPGPAVAGPVVLDPMPVPPHDDQPAAEDRDQVERATESLIAEAIAVPLATETVPGAPVGDETTSILPEGAEPILIEELIWPDALESESDVPPIPDPPRLSERPFGGELPGVPEPEITILAPRTAVPALPALMAREITLGDAARAVRGALPALTMTDGRQLRRAVAVGAATSVVAAAFAIRGRKRR